MKLLLDTHAFLWWDSEPARLSATAFNACKDPSNILILSTVSVWEMQVKSQLGKLTLNLPLSEIIKGQQETNKLIILPMALEHVLALQDLPPYHKDPFDRLLVAQAKVEEAVLVSHDSVLVNYPVQLLW
jgi:PIN domain nuclease of toxin-antitoxin system